MIQLPSSEWNTDEPWPGPSEWHDLPKFPESAHLTIITPWDYTVEVHDFGGYSFKEFLYKSGIEPFVHAYLPEHRMYVLVVGARPITFSDRPSWIQFDVKVQLQSDEAADDMVQGVPYLCTIQEVELEWPPDE